MSNDTASLLRSLYAQQLSERPDWYLEAHRAPNAIMRRVDVFERYVEHLPSAGAILDWGCYHAPDSCLVRAALGDDIELHGCDFADHGLFPAFHDYSRLNYQQLSSPYTLPYADETFDVVIGSGALEHTADDSRSLAEVHRILKEGGLLILTFLPNRWSYTEFLGRRLGRVVHRRLYGHSEARRLLLHHGFLPVVAGPHQMVPGQQLPGVLSRLWALNAVLERAWPLNLMATNHMFISHRRSMM